jgi:hypothetical protein
VRLGSPRDEDLVDPHVFLQPTADGLAKYLYNGRIHARQ